jgi:PAS domain S-box-containing protein
MHRRRRSIAFLVAAMLVGATTLVLGLFAWVNHRSECMRQTARLESEHHTTVEQLAVSLTLPVWNFDRAQIDRVLESAMQNPELAAVLVRLEDVHATVHGRGRDGQWRVQSIVREPVSADLLAQTARIAMGTETLGTVRAFVTPRFMQQALRQELASNIIIIVILDGLLVTGLYLLLWRLVLRPIQALERRAGEVSQGGSAGMPLAAPRFQGELEGLRASLDDMIRLLHGRYDALQESQRTLSTLLSNLPGVAYRCRNDPDWTMEIVSDACRELTGYATEELIENRKTSYGRLIHPDERGRVWDEVQACLREHRPFELTYRIRTADGAEKWVWERGRGVYGPDGVLMALEGFINDVTARHRAEEERQGAVLREQRAREDFTRRLIASQEAERRRIAGELHDSLGQNLLLIKNRSELALGVAGTRPEVLRQLESINEVASQAIEEVRQISHDLRPYQLDQLGLTRSLEVMIDNAARSSSIVFERKLDFADDGIAGDAATNLYRVVQECLNNVLKHSRARHARVELERDIHELRLHLSDDGVGFDASTAQAPGATAFGLRNIAERVRIMGGRLRITSRPGAGTSTEVRIPLAEREGE